MHPSIAWYLAVYPCRVTFKKKRSLLHIQLRSIPTAIVFDANNRDQKTPPSTPKAEPYDVRNAPLPLGEPFWMPAWLVL